MGSNGNSGYGSLKPGNLMMMTKDEFGVPCLGDIYTGSCRKYSNSSPNKKPCKGAFAATAWRFEAGLGVALTVSRVVVKIT